MKLAPLTGAGFAFGAGKCDNKLCHPLLLWWEEEPAVNISLTPKLEKYVHAKVKTGTYTSASEVVREALRALAVKDEKEQALAVFQAELDRRIDSLDRGEGVDGERFFAALRKRTRSLQRKSA